jgi:dsDNA-specific endonuclease/ATPase MutS2
MEVEIIMEKALKILEFNKIKEDIKKHSSSNLGKELIDSMMPNTNPNTVLNKYEETKEAVNIIREGTGISLGGISDISMYTSKIEKGMFLHPEELLKVADFLRCIRNVKKSISKYEFIAPLLYSYSLGLESFQSVEKEIEYCIEGSIVSSRASSTLEKIRKKINTLEGKRIDKLNKFLTNDKNTKYIQENFFSQRDGRYVIPIKASARKFVAGTVIDSSSKGSTVYIEIDSIKDLTVEIMMYKSQEEEECYQILRTLSGLVLEHMDSIKGAVRIVANYDFIFSKAKYSVAIAGNEIEIKDDETIHLLKARHPLLGKDVVPLDISIGHEYRTMVITGPNTGGKTVTLKTAGLMVVMVQCGILPPVAPGSSISIFNKILVDIGDSQNLEQSLSTFSGHMKSLVNIVTRSSRRTLVLIDEIGTGTDPRDGSALGIGILEEIYNRGAITLVSTHYSKIKEYSDIHPGFINASMDFDRKTLKPLYKLLIGVAGESNALWISKELGLPDKILNRVNEINSTHEIVSPRKISSFSKKKSRVQEIIESKKAVDENKTIYNKGDRVLINETKKYGVVFDHITEENRVVVFINDEYKDFRDNRLTLDKRREVLYPEGYDLDQLFISFKRRKLEKDIKRGGFKNLDELKERFEMLNKDK